MSKIKIKKILNRNACVEILKNLASEIEKGSLKLEESIIEIPNEVEFEYKFKEKKDEKKLELEIKWKK